MPIPVFMHPTTRICSVLEAHLFHHCLDIILEPLKQAARFGRMMSDPLGNLHFCFTPLVSYIIDTPEACMLACVQGHTSPVTTATYREFGDPNHHPPHTAALTLTQLQSIQCDVNDVEWYFAACEDFQLSGVSHPFWHDWLYAEPSQFLTPEALHHWHRQFWDHDMQWCKHALGAGELDFRFSVLPPITGLCRFSQGIMKLKQVAIITGFPDVDVIIAIWALMEFQYPVQAPAITSQMHDHILAALKTFHDHKHAIIGAGLCHGQTTGAALDHWDIPKLEFMQSVTPIIKDPVTTMNNQNYDSQICCTLDRDEKCCLFNTTISLSKQTNIHDTLTGDNSETDAPDHGDRNMPNGAGDDTIDNILHDLWSSDHSPTRFFNSTEKLSSASPGSVPMPLCMLDVGHTVL
ncbi:hypothetical protein BKA83DRAFT_4497906 [Pisolithus microcarpus]|nr:hypothetical protein BKA83DRAFT_4497906 [Pisolithus microcarpus]